MAFAPSPAPLDENVSRRHRESRQWESDCCTRTQMYRKETQAARRSSILRPRDTLLCYILHADDESSQSLRGYESPLRLQGQPLGPWDRLSNSKTLGEKTEETHRQPGQPRPSRMHPLAATYRGP